MYPVAQLNTFTLTLSPFRSCGKACRQYVRLRSWCTLADLVALQEMTFLCMYLICRLAVLSPYHSTSTRYRQDCPEHLHNLGFVKPSCEQPLSGQRDAHRTTKHYIEQHHSIPSLKV